MRKFKCVGCENNCEAHCELAAYFDDYSPIFCLYDPIKVNWHEVKYNSAENAQTTAEPEQLPDWCKVGEWGYDTSREKYFEIVGVTPFNVEVAYLDDALTTVIGISIFNADCVQAHKRPFNDKEMREIVGKNLETPGFVKFIFSYDKEEGTLESYDFLYTADDLFEDDFKFDGKPCYVLEHRNDKGEWVK